MDRDPVEPARLIERPLELAPACPGVGLTLRTVPFSEGVRLLEGGESDLHCGGVDGGQRLPAYLRREPLLEVTAGIVARRDHPLQRARPTLDDLVHCPWLDSLDGYASSRTGTCERGASLGSVLARLHELGLKPLPLTFGRRRYRTGLVARRAAEDLAPVPQVRGHRARHRARAARLSAAALGERMPTCGARCRTALR